MNGFEEHARRAAADAHESVTRLAVPDLGGAPSTGRRLILAAAAVALIAIAGFLVVRATDDTASLDVVGDPDQTENVTTDGESGEAAYFAFPIDPDWMVFATEQSTPEGADEIGLSLYGAAVGNDPLGDGYLLIAAVADSDRELGPAFDDRLVRGTTAYVTNNLAPGATGLEWIEPDGTLVQVGSDVLHEAALVDIANGLEINGLDVTVPQPPDGMTLVVDSFSTEQLVTITSGWALSASSDDQTRSGSLTGAAGSEDALQVLRVIYGATDAVELRGTTGYASITDNAGIVVWREQGTLLALFAPADRDPLQMAEEVEQVSAADWAALVERSIDPSQGSSGADDLDDGTADDERIIASGDTTIDGQDFIWSVSERTEGAHPSVCIDVLSDSEGLGHCVNLAQTATRVVMQASEDGLPGVVLGMVGEADRVVLTTSSGGRDLPVFPTTTGDLAFGLALGEGERPITVRTLGESGRELRRWTFGLETPQGDITGGGSRPDGNGGTCFEVDYLDETYNLCSPTSVATLELDSPATWLIAAWTPGCTDWAAIDGIAADQTVPELDWVGFNGEVVTVVNGTPTTMTAYGPTGTATIDLTDPAATWTSDWLCDFEQPEG